ncbi:sigma 54-interacting transcriptional regulator [Phaeocystidibacter luteus]|uniref:Magnesium chelatase n=1 Tax=Phaeocystidibacter luteus TaxID=911197 RepID=A0A6N6RIR8_9FLAO|nr:sigma 54-interacting transcriptional regulator [Phaeocystidibacter luteus]KAB2814192.1 magnesium chelatase [Phaeocystidibacter luteus]
MSKPTIKTLGELLKAGYKSKSIKDELRDNLLNNISNGVQVFEGIWGYEHTVIPELERAILSRHNINLLGLRGQAKTRLARMMTRLLDEWVPIVAGSEINDDPLNPISTNSRELIEKEGDNTPIDWLHRDDRYSEKLATPDVSVADLIGDVDPIKAANLKLSYADERVIHFGMIPRANRSIFVINELPDLQARIQVALFNILQEGDIQIRGFKLRLPLDVQFVFTANPEDYTNRGSIVTPLKDRIGSQILTHYPETRDIAKQITAQEAGITATQREHVSVPSIAMDILEQIAFEARKSEYIDAKSGVSARMTLTAMENLMSAAERRMALNGEKETTIRLSDFMATVPSITGKVELVYEGEQEGAAGVAESLIGNAIKSVFPEIFPGISKLRRSDDDNPYLGIMNWFGEGKSIDLGDDVSNKEYASTLNKVGPLVHFIDARISDASEAEKPFYMEMVLWGLAEHAKLGRDRLHSGFQFNDLFNSYLSSTLRDEDE